MPADFAFRAILKKMARSSVMSRNIVANAMSQAWAMVLGILALPLYLLLLGPTYYGLIGFGMTIQVVVNLADAGFSPALGRNVARMRVGLEDPLDLAIFLRSLDWIFLALVLILSVAGIATRSWWATDWFGVVGDTAEIVGHSIALILISSAMRCMAALYRGAIVNLEKQVFTSGVVVAVNAIRLLLPLPFLAYVPDPRIVFAIWVAGAFFEVILLRSVLGRNLPVEVAIGRFSWKSVRKHVSFTGGVAALAIIHTFATQYDKLLLSRMLTLEDYGYFSLAIVLSGAMLTLPAAVVQAIQPRVTGSIASPPEQARLIGILTELIVMLAVAPAIAISVFPQSAVLGWVNDQNAVAIVSPYLGFYVVGSALAGVSSAAFMLQIAAGRMRMHIIANLVLVAVMVPLVYFAAMRSGATGTAYLWLAVNAAFAALYAPFAVERMLPGRGWSWFSRSVIVPIFAAMIGALTIRLLLGDAVDDRLQAIARIASAGGAAVAGAALASPSVRSFIRRRHSFLVAKEGPLP